MGSASSKAARSVTRKYPAQAAKGAIGRAQPSNLEPEHRSKENSAASHTSRLDENDSTAMNGDFSHRLKQMGIAQPSHTYSPPTMHTVQSRSTDLDQPSVPMEPMFPPSRNNPTVSALEARRRLQHRADADFEAIGLAHHRGRRFVDMRTLLDALRLRDRGMSLSDIERRLGLESKLLNKLGRQGVIRHVSAS